MRTFTVLFAALALAACGGSDSKTADAKPSGIDSAPGTPDAPGGTPDAAGGGLTGLGQKCASDNECPANAPKCVGVTANTAWCTPTCVENATGMTNAQGQFASLSPTPDNTKCTGAYTGSVGSPTCAIILATTPDDNPLKPNTSYTGVSFGCAVLCGAGNACPGGMTADTSLGACVCLPN